MFSKKNGILDPEGLERNPLTGKRGYSEEYLNAALGTKQNPEKAWSKFPVYKSGPERLIKIIKDNRVIVLESGPGSGKTVLIPKFALHATDYKKKIIVTVPKRGLALSNAIRDAKWMDVTLGKEVGYRYRGSKLGEAAAEIKGDNTSYSDDTKLLFATDGTLVSILSRDVKLSEYAIAIIDEVHERSTGIDEAILFMRDALRLNRKLKLILMSATLPETDMFLNYFAEFDPHHEELPCKENKFEVKLHWSKQNFMKKADAVKESVRILFDEIINKDKDGDVLIFVNAPSAGIEINREINSKRNDIFTMILNKETKDEQLKLATDEFLYKEQGEWSRKVVVATNAAESSLTIDGLVFVIDNGMELKSDFDADAQQEILMTQFITKAQAIQRKGRAGRTCPGECYRLYTKDTYDDMEPSQKVSILSEDMTTNFLKYLSSPRIKDLLDLVRFVGSLIQVPDNDNIINSIWNLVSLGLVSEYDYEGKLTDEGKMAVGLMNDGRIDTVYMAKALMVSRYFRCEGVMIIIAAILPSIRSGIGDLFKKPKGNKVKDYEETLKFFQHPYGDIFSFYKILLKYSNADERMSKQELTKWCRQNFLNETVLRIIKEKAIFIKKKTWRRLNKIEQMDEEYQFKNCEEAALFSLFKGYYLNLSKRVPGGNKYSNFYPQDNTTASFDRRGNSFFSLLGKNIPTYMFYINNWTMDKNTTFVGCNKITLEMIKLLKPYELSMLRGLKV